MTQRIYGVDGCRGGWYAVSTDLDAKAPIATKIYPHIADLIADAPFPAVLGIDIPIGLLERGARECDRAARMLLGWGRASSVFPAPIRAVLGANTYEGACQIRDQIEQKKLSHQAWGIVAKVREVDELLERRPKLKGIFREVHPEVSFSLLAGGSPIRQSKKTAAGKQARRALLEPLYGAAVAEALVARDRRACAEDDIMDAFAVLWSAGRIAAGTGLTLPAAPPVDTHGLRMEINA